MGRLAGVLALLCATGCFGPTINDAEISCGVDELCPTGFVCINGLCRNKDPGPNVPDASVPDAVVPDAPPLPSGPKVYQLADGDWSAQMATEYFVGSNVNPAAVVTAFSFCTGGSTFRCFADDTNVSCLTSVGWAVTTWDDIDGGLADYGTTYTSAYMLGGTTWALDVQRGEDWRGYEGPVPVANAGVLTTDMSLEFRSGNNGVPDLNEIYGGDNNAPDAFDDVVADYIDTTQGGDPWSFLTATGYRFTIGAGGGDSTGDQEPTLAIPGAPLAGDIRAALMCNGELLFYATN